ncbi:histidine phosphatase family protein [Paenibacillus xylanilyticus]|uniref:Histidine phosphatase family protein n=1 Tax=Paenibacillus xylanilyticus TaxID=248903 RepID=A0A7Y6EU05_9BACL|nr:histidine phosphatase family protein [Paenibacillus xylanilyticus]NUU76537.1 histidine phosphatase family protein [Paenibacillus xylanilyticus]
MRNEATTVLYFVRHAESAYVEGQERERGLTEQGKRDAAAVATLLREERIQCFYSSPYKRAVDTIQELAEGAGAFVVTVEDLRERKLSDETVKHADFRGAKQRLYLDPSFAYPGGESGEQACSRAVPVIERILDTHAGQKVAIGTHGDVMTLIFQHFDPSYGYDFWVSTTMPDIYKLEFDKEHNLV